MVHFLLSIAAFAVTIGVLVTFHEFGHFWVARRLGFKILRFSVGFGNPIARFRGRAPDHTEYWLASIPLGGYVKWLDEREGPVENEADRARAANNRPPPYRIAVMLAGPAFNFLFAILAYWLLFIIGVPALKPYIGDVTPGSIAARAGLQAQDQIQSVGGTRTETWDDATLAILNQMLHDGRIPMTVVDPNGATRRVELDVQGQVERLSEPSDLFPGLGIERGPVRPPVIGAVTPGGPADAAGLRAGDRITALNGQPVASFEALGDLIRQRQPGQKVTLSIERDGQSLTKSVEIRSLEQNGKSYPAIGVESTREPPAGWDALAKRLTTEQRYGPGRAFIEGAHKTWEMSAMTVRMLVHMITGEVSVRNLSGPIAIATFAGDSAQAGFGAFLGFLAVVSISLGILNLLPVPILDGGQVVYQLIEWVKGSPLSERAMILGQQVGIGLLIVLMGFVFYNDLTRVFS